MIVNSGILKQMTNLGLLLMMGVNMSAEAGLFGSGGTSWKEEVLLHDGSKIIVERSITRGGHGIAQQSIVTDESLTFTMPGTKQHVVWADKFSPDLGSSSFNLLMLEIRKDTAYLAASPMGCLSYNKWGRPNPPYVVFKYQGKTWNRITLPELPAEFKIPNLVISSPDERAKRASQGLVTMEIVKELNSTARQPEYKTILREALVRERCPQYSSGPKAPIPIAPSTLPK